MKKRSSRAGDLRHRERRFADREVSRGEDDDNLATREGRSMRLPLVDDDGEVAEEIEGNALADGLARVVDVVGPHLRAIALGIAGLLLAAVAWMWMNQQQSDLEAASWNEFLAATQTTEPGLRASALAEVVTRNPRAPAGAWARLLQAEMSLEEGARLLFVDRGQAEPKLEAAIGAYRETLDARPTGLLAERATFGLAEANESLGQIDEARTGYEAVVADHPAGILAGPARQRLAALASGRAGEWYAWFASQKMTPPPTTPRDDSPILGLPGDGLPPTAPAGDPPPPPAAGAAEAPAADAAAPAEGAVTLPPQGGAAEPVAPAAEPAAPADAPAAADAPPQE